MYKPLKELLIAEFAATKFSRSFRNVWGETQAEAALTGAADLPAAGMSWEQWFLFIDPAIPSRHSVETLMSPFVHEMNEQMERFFVPFLLSCTADCPAAPVALDQHSLGD